MATLSQLAKLGNKHVIKPKRNFKPSLRRCPQKKGVCNKLVIRTPKKPHSARRKTARITLSTRKKISCYVPGIAHSLQVYAVVLVRGGRRRDIPGIKYTLISGKFDFPFPVFRRSARSKYGIPGFK
jgi:small subunit ribosomal protein S12